jgi:sialate O-acetylesterase
MYLFTIRLSIRLALAVLFTAGTKNLLRAEISMPAYFGNHMVIQQYSSLRIWGWANPGEERISPAAKNFSLNR